MYEIRLRHRHRHIKTRICFTLSYTIHVHEIKNNQKFQLYFIKFLEGYFLIEESGTAFNDRLPANGIGVWNG